MNFVRLYTRVLEMLGGEARLGWTLAVFYVAACIAAVVAWRRRPA